MSNGAGAGLLPRLASKSKGRAASSASAGGTAKASGVARLLRLLARGAFDDTRFSELKHHARGATGDIYRARMTEPMVAPSPTPSISASSQQQQQIVIKSVSLASSAYDRCVLPDLFGEILILERFKGCPGICQMIDYGLTPEAYWIVMKRYRCSLAEWRTRQVAGPIDARAAALYLAVLLQVVRALQLLSRDAIVHFDLKCSNVLIEPHDGVRDGQLWNPLGWTATGGGGGGDQVDSGAAAATATAAAAAPQPPFDTVLADFGEARSYRSEAEAFTVRNRGTEVYKSPEMLMLNSPAGATSGTFSRGWPSRVSALGANRVSASGAKAGQPEASSLSAAPAAAVAKARARCASDSAGLASDVWSLGCLSYELLSGRVLFGGDYASVTHRVAFGEGPFLALNESEVESLGGRPELVALVEGVLMRNPRARPSLTEIEARVIRARDALLLSPGAVAGSGSGAATAAAAAAAAPTTRA
ncbi:hypothetical protein FOA52_016278 [Chlamydomonas sp. UWO 241]|nr:hypothetical protein FOA52_016278 [Chlamydomonas sp. UWO 241]